MSEDMESAEEMWGASAENSRGESAEEMWGQEVSVSTGSWVRAVWTGREHDVGEKGPYEKIMVKLAPGEPLIPKFPPFLLATPVVKQTLLWFQASIGDVLTVVLTHYQGEFSRWAIVRVEKGDSSFGDSFTALADEDDFGEPPTPDDSGFEDEELGSGDVDGSAG